MNGTDQSRTAQLKKFNEELSRRLASLDRGEHADPADLRERLERKSSGKRPRESA